MSAKTPTSTSAHPSQLLALVPIRNLAVRVEPREEGLVVWIPLHRPAWMSGPLSYILPFRKEKGVALDAIGADVYLACDGERRLETIIDEFAAKHRLRFHEARQSVVAFLKSLVERKLVVLASPPMRDA